MNCVFKGFFDDPDSAEAAYYALRNKQLVNDLETSDLATSHFSSLAPQIAYASEGNLLLNYSPEQASAVTDFYMNSDPRVAMTPFLTAFSKKEKEDSQNSSFYLYGHCRRKDLDAVSACLRRFGAHSVLSSGIDQASYLHH